MTPVMDQLRFFAYSAVLGILVGLIFDVYRTLRGLAKPKKWTTGFGDLALWFFLTAFVFVVLLFINLGEVRVYVFIAMIIGFAFYVKVFSRRLLLFLRHLFLGLGSCWRIFWRTFFLIVSFVWKVLFYPIGLLTLMAGGAGRLIGMIAKGFGRSFAKITIGSSRVIKRFIYKRFNGRGPR